MEKRIQDELNILKDIIINTVPVEQIFLFGSYANGVPHDDSDLDIYVYFIHLYKLSPYHRRFLCHAYVLPAHEFDNLCG